MLQGSKIFVYTEISHFVISTVRAYYDGDYFWKTSILGDAFSRLPRLDDITEGKKSSASTLEESLFSSLTDNKMMLDCFLNLPTQRQMRYPLDLRWIQENQFEDQELNNMRQEHPANFPAHTIDGIPLLCYQRDHLDEKLGQLQDLYSKWFTKGYGNVLS